MPHMFVDRPRLFDPARGAGPRGHLRWEAVNTTVYLVGGALFVWGSVEFLPSFEARSDLGAWIFFGASLLYLVVAGHDIVEVARHRRLNRQWRAANRREAWAATSYLLGSTLFAVGSIFFLPGVGWNDPGAVCFVVGSLLFVLGATVNVLQIVEAADRHTLQLMNLTALSYVTGSVLFTVASVPYLFDLDPTDQRTIDTFLAGQYVIGSVLFLVGGIINYRRARIVGRRAIGAATGSAAHPGEPTVS